jgi:hypothetical protein
MGPKPPGRGKDPVPGPASAPECDPNPRWASRTGWRHPVQVFGRDDPAEDCGGSGMPLALGRCAGQGEATGKRAKLGFMMTI